MLSDEEMMLLHSCPASWFKEFITYLGLNNHILRVGDEIIDWSLDSPDDDSEDGDEDQRALDDLIFEELKALV